MGHTMLRRLKALNSFSEHEPEIPDPVTLTPTSSVSSSRGGYNSSISSLRSVSSLRVPFPQVSSVRGVADKFVEKMEADGKEKIDRLEAARQKRLEKKAKRKQMLKMQTKRDSDVSLDSLVESDTESPDYNVVRSQSLTEEDLGSVRPNSAGDLSKLTEEGEEDQENGAKPKRTHRRTHSDGEIRCSIMQPASPDMDGSFSSIGNTFKTGMMVHKACATFIQNLESHGKDFKVKYEKERRRSKDKDTNSKDSDRDKDKDKEKDKDDKQSPSSKKGKSIMDALESNGKQYKKEYKQEKALRKMRGKIRDHEKKKRSEKIKQTLAEKKASPW